MQVRWGLLCLVLIYAYAQESDSLDIGAEAWEDFLSMPTSAPKDTSPPPASEAPWLYDTLLEPPKPPPPLRLIDSPIARDLTMDPKTNRRISTNRAFTVKIVRAIPQNTKGYPLIHGFDTWYLYIVRAEEVRIENRVMRTNGLPVYLAIVSPAPQIEELPTVLESPALMLKGLVDYGDTIVKYFKQEKKRLRATLDSLLALPVPPDELQADQMEALLTRVADSLVYAEAYYELYKDFKRAKGSGKALVQFFLSFPFNRTLTYSIYSAPYALPRYLPPETTSPPAERKRKSRRS